MNIEQNFIKGLRLEPSQVRDALKVLVHSILFQRELGVVTPRQVESECGVTYLTLNDIDTDKQVEEKLVQFENKLIGGQAQTLVLSFYQAIKRKTFLLFQESAKVVWEEWRIPVSLVPVTDGEEKRKSDQKLAKKLRKRILAIVEKICEKKDHLPSMGEADDPAIIRYPFEISFPEGDGGWGAGFFGKIVPPMMT